MSSGAEAGGGFSYSDIVILADADECIFVSKILCIR